MNSIGSCYIIQKNTERVLILNELIEKIKNQKSRVITESFMKASAVCIPLIRNGDSFDVLFEVRAANIKAQPGDICFPGGGVEKGESPREAACRELCEELLVKPDQLEIIGEADKFFNPFGMVVYPFVGILSDYENTFDEEVDEVFRVPLSFFLETEPDVYYNKMTISGTDDFPYELIQGGRSYRWREGKQTSLFFHWGERHIWGLTAKLLYYFIKYLKDDQVAEL